MKKVFSIVMMVALILFISGCQKEEEVVELSSLTITGVHSYRVDKDEVVNLMEGITVVGNDGVDYSEYVILTSYTCGFYDEVYLHTNVTKKCDVIFTAVVGNFFVREQTIIYID